MSAPAPRPAPRRTSRPSPFAPSRILIAAALALAAACFGAPARAQTYVADETAWRLDRVGRDLVVLRTPLNTVNRGSAVGLLMFVCAPSSSKLVVSFSDSNSLRSAGVVARGSAAISVQEAGRRQAGDRQIMAGANMLPGGSFEIVDIPSETTNVVGSVARFIASGARQVTFSLFGGSSSGQFVKDRVVRVRFPENAEAEALPAEFQIACLQLARPGP
ncbi:hypothetical protein NK718_05000 [Alsobacter sp. SYSU M60028]|uniref:Uncharacterized protein n=1 Tax=Alsobacter ponti TaxID=2962936 RepID=A0ABT1L8T5_9HYPH|nr:hypothetical protein [Alsobacter ponti]MCP8937864.1 hypothetical protein [Alsobacter ponti]